MLGLSCYFYLFTHFLYIVSFTQNVRGTEWLYVC